MPPRRPGLGLTGLGWGDEGLEVAAFAWLEVEEGSSASRSRVWVAMASLFGLVMFCAIWGGLGGLLGWELA